MAGAAVLGRLTWLVAEVADLVEETPRTHTLVLHVEGWSGHRAGQHVDIRLTAEDGYQAERSYSIASGPDDGRLELTVELIEDGEVSPYLVEEVRPGDTFELRGGRSAATSRGSPTTAARCSSWAAARASCLSAPSSARGRVTCPRG